MRSGSRCSQMCTVCTHFASLTVLRNVLTSHSSGTLTFWLRNVTTLSLHQIPTVVCIFLTAGWGQKKMFSVFSCLIFDFRLQSSNWFLLAFLSWCPLISATAAHQTQGESTQGCSSIFSLFSPFWQRPLTAESFWISAIMFSLCNPPHRSGGVKKNRSFYVCYIIPAFLSPSLAVSRHSRLQMYRISPWKTLGGCTINSCLVRGITKIISMDTPPSAESAERPFLSSKRSNYPMTSKTSDDIKQKDRRGTWLYSHLWVGVDKGGCVCGGEGGVSVASSQWPLQLTPPIAALLEIIQNLYLGIFNFST